jgi:hypothetical protein
LVQEADEIMAELENEEISEKDDDDDNHVPEYPPIDEWYSDTVKKSTAMMQAVGKPKTTSTQSPPAVNPAISTTAPP